MSRSSGHCRWDAQNEEDEKLQALWQFLHANAQHKAQSLWPEVPLGNGPDQRFETLAWGPEPNVPRVANGVKDRVDRLKALGNAVVPQIPEMIGRAILAAQDRHG
jgi:DNA (cytosine-5)-methyltransferase 1